MQDLRAYPCVDPRRLKSKTKCSGLKSEVKEEKKEEEGEGEEQEEDLLVEEEG